MTKSINEINALNSANKAQSLASATKPARAGGVKRKKAAKAASAASAGSTSARPRKKAASQASAGSTFSRTPQNDRRTQGGRNAPGPRSATTQRSAQTGRTGSTATGRAAQKRAQRIAARNLFANDVQVSGDNLRATNLAAGVTSPLTTLAPGATLRAAPGQRPVLLFDTGAMPEVAALPEPARKAVTQATSGSRNLSIGRLYNSLSPVVGAAEAFAFCEKILQQRWDAFMAAAKAWQEDMAENAKLSAEAALRSQQRASEQKKQHEASQAQTADAIRAAQDSLNAKHALAQAAVVRTRIRPRSAPAPIHAATTASAASAVGATVTTSTADTLDNTPIAGFALTAPAAPTRPAPASPEERGARPAKRLRQSADADMV